MANPTVRDATTPPSGEDSKTAKQPKKFMTPNEKKDALIEKLKAKVEEYKTTVEQKDREIEAAGEAVQEEQKRNMANSQLLNAMGKEGEALQNELNEAKQERARLQARVAKFEELQEEFAETKAALREANELLVHKDEEIVSAHGKESELQKALQAERDNVSNLVAQCEDLRQEVDKCDEVKMQLEMYKSSLQQKDQEVDSAASEGVELQRELKKRGDLVATLRAEVESLNSVLDMRTAKEKDRRIEEVRIVKEQADREIERLRHKAEEFEATIEVKTTKASEAAKLNEKLRMALDALEAEGAELRKHNEMLIKHIEAHDEDTPSPLPSPGLSPEGSQGQASPPKRSPPKPRHLVEDNVSKLRASSVGTMGPGALDYMAVGPPVTPR